jgi:hypothetical protein
MTKSIMAGCRYWQQKGLKRAIHIILHSQLTKRKHPICRPLQSNTPDCIQNTTEEGAMRVQLRTPAQQLHLSDIALQRHKEELILKCTPLERA